MFGRKPVDLQAQIELAQQLYRYQNFRAVCLENKIQSDNYQFSSIKAFHSLLRRYLATGEKDLQRATDTFYNTIDKLKETHCAILTPSQKDLAPVYKRKPKGVRKSKSYVSKSIPVEVGSNTQTSKINLSQDTLNKIKKTDTVVGIKVNDCIKLFDNEDIMKGFVDAFSFMENPPVYKKVKVTISEI